MKEYEYLKNQGDIAEVLNILSLNYEVYNKRVGVLHQIVDCFTMQSK